MTNFSYSYIFVDIGVILILIKIGDYRRDFISIFLKFENGPL